MNKYLKFIKQEKVMQDFYTEPARIDFTVISRAMRRMACDVKHSITVTSASFSSLYDARRCSHTTNSRRQHTVSKLMHFSGVAVFGEVSLQAKWSLLCAIILLPVIHCVNRSEKRQWWWYRKFHNRRLWYSLKFWQLANTLCVICSC